MCYSNNRVRIVGVVMSKPKFSHNCYNEDFYSVILSVMRDSGAYDEIDVIIPERLYPMENVSLNDNLCVEGEYRSKNFHDGDSNRLFLSVFAKSVRLIIEKEPIYENEIDLEGFVCKPVIYRKTPMNRQIGDMMLAVNRRSGKSDYIPCIAWGRNAVFASSFRVGTRVMLSGRIQSRKYIKRIEDSEIEKKTNEVSICRLEPA